MESYRAAITSTIGGMMGSVLGCVATGKIGQIASIKHATPNEQIILIAFGISVGVGVIFGYLPAKKAARLNPIDALRSE